MNRGVALCHSPYKIYLCKLIQSDAKKAFRSYEAEILFFCSEALKSMFYFMLYECTTYKNITYHKLGGDHFGDFQNLNSGLQRSYEVSLKKDD